MLASPSSLGLKCLSPGDDVGAGDYSKFFRLYDADELHERFHIVLVGTAGVGIVNIGKPFDLERGLNALWKDGGLMYAPPFR